MAATENEANLQRALESWNAGNLDGYLELYDESVTLHGYSPSPMDKTAVRGFYEAIFEAFDGPQLVFHEVLSAGNRVCIRFTMTGTHRGEFMGVPATDKAIALDGITVLRFRKDKCVERWSCADMLGLLVQIGAIPPPGQE